MFFKHKASILIFIILTITSSRSFADINDMQSFFDEIGVYGNAQGPSNFRGQTRSYYTGGSLSVRVPNKTYQIATFDPPRLSASCGGIDMFAGSFSFINSDQLVQMMQNIGNNAAGALFSLALESVSPQLSAAIKFFQDQAAKLNALNINSCEAAKGIIRATADSGLSGSFNNAVKGLGQTYSGVASDWAAMKEEMQNPATDVSEEISKKVRGDSNMSESEKMLVSGTNLLYKALSKVTKDTGGGFSTEEKRFIQAILGTIIIYPKKVNGKTKLTSEYIAPTIENPLIYLMGSPTSNLSYNYRACQSFSYGSTSYSASECIKLSSTLTSSGVGSSFRKIIRDKINSVRNKIQNRQVITSSDYNIVNMSHLPIWSLIEDEYRTNNGLGILDNSEELIALDYVKALLGRVIKITKNSLLSLEKIENAGISAHIENYREAIYEVKADISHLYGVETQKYNAFITSRDALINNSTRIKMMTSKRLAMAKKMIR